MLYVALRHPKWSAKQSYLAVPRNALALNLVPSNLYCYPLTFFQALLGLAVMELSCGSWQVLYRLLSLAYITPR